jgi:hypothetical protein
MDDFLKSYLERLKSEYSKRSAEIAAGKCSSFEDYKSKSAYVQALSDAMNWLVAARDQATRPEDEYRRRRSPSEAWSPRER